MKSCLAWRGSVQKDESVAHIKQAVSFADLELPTALNRGERIHIR